MTASRTRLVSLFCLTVVFVTHAGGQPGGQQDGFTTSSFVNVVTPGVRSAFSWNAIAAGNTVPWAILGRAPNSPPKTSYLVLDDGIEPAGGGTYGAGSNWFAKSVNSTPQTSGWTCYGNGGLVRGGVGVVQSSSGTVTMP